MEVCGFLPANWVEETLKNVHEATGIDMPKHLFKGIMQCLLANDKHLLVRVESLRASLDVSVLLSEIFEEVFGLTTSTIVCGNNVSPTDVLSHLFINTDGKGNAKNQSGEFQRVPKSPNTEEKRRSYHRRTMYDEIPPLGLNRSSASSTGEGLALLEMPRRSEDGPSSPNLERKMLTSSLYLTEEDARSHMSSSDCVEMSVIDHEEQPSTPPPVDGRTTPTFVVRKPSSPLARSGAMSHTIQIEPESEQPSKDHSSAGDSFFKKITGRRSRGRSLDMHHNDSVDSSRKSVGSSDSNLHWNDDAELHRRLRVMSVGVGNFGTRDQASLNPKKSPITPTKPYIVSKDKSVGSLERDTFFQPPMSASNLKSSSSRPLANEGNEPQLFPPPKNRRHRYTVSASKTEEYEKLDFDDSSREHTATKNMLKRAERRNGAFSGELANVLIVERFHISSKAIQQIMLEVLINRRIAYKGNIYPLPEPFFIVYTATEEMTVVSELLRDTILMSIPLQRPITRIDPRQCLYPLIDYNFIRQLKSDIPYVFISRDVVLYVRDITVAARNHQEVAYGISSRATTDLEKAARTEAFLSGHYFITPEHINSVAVAVLNHRIVLRSSLVMTIDNATDDKSEAALQVPEATCSLIVASVLQSVPSPI
eukprot:Nk52_evm10s1869 gene=Nk52_evmTU10s1869